MCISVAIIRNFNPRSHERSDSYTKSFSTDLPYFNPRSHERSDNPLLVLCSLAIIFQSTLPREERHCAKLLNNDFANFNPRSHERSDRNKYLSKINIIISIHAPTRGATKTDLKKYLPLCHFNPRSHERSDLAVKTVTQSASYFNPRSHERSDNKQMPVSLYRLISIHAPTRGATHLILLPANSVFDFNPRSHERSDNLRGGVKASISQFQSTLPREERRACDIYP